LSTDQETKTAQPGALALLLGRDEKTSAIRLESGAVFHTLRGTVALDDLSGVPWGSEVEMHLGAPLILLRPLTDDLLRTLERTTRIVVAEDPGCIPRKMDIAPGRRVMETRTGGGELTWVFARADVQEVARKKRTRMHLAPYVTLKQRDISAGFDERNADATFLDALNPWDFVEPAYATLAGGSSLDPSCRLPTR